MPFCCCVFHHLKFIRLQHYAREAPPTNIIRVVTKIPSRSMARNEYRSNVTFLSFCYQTSSKVVFSVSFVSTVSRGRNSVVLLDGKHSSFCLQILYGFP